MLNKVLDFVSVVSRQGKMRVIVVPKRFHKNVDDLDGKQIRIIVEDILDDL